MPYKALYTFDKKSGRNSVGATSTQMEFLRTGTKSKDKTAKKYKPQIKQFFDEQTTRILARYMAFFNIKDIKESVNPSQLDILIDYIFPLPQENAALKQATKPLFTSAVQKSVDDVNELAGATVSSSLINPAVAQAINRLTEKVVNINLTTRKMLKEVITTGIEQGQSIYDIANNIKDTGLDEWYANRSLTIARTETRMAYDAGGQIAYKDLGAETFSVVGCIGTLAGENSLGLSASYGDFSEKTGSCGVTDVAFNLWDGVSGLHHPSHAGVMVADKIK